MNFFGSSLGSVRECTYLVSYYSKPRPLLSARAVSIAALRANRLVCIGDATDYPEHCTDALAVMLQLRDNLASFVYVLRQPLDPRPSVIDHLTTPMRIIVSPLSCFTSMSPALGHLVTGS